MISLLWPWLLLVFTLLVVFFLKKKKWGAGILVLVLCFVLNWAAECIPFRLWPINNMMSPCLKVMSFNIDGLEDGSESKIPLLSSFIKDINPEVLFFTEYRETDKFALDTLLLDKLPYSTYDSKSGNGFYSKYPLSKMRVLKTDGDNSGVYSTMAVIDSDSIYLYGCHLASNNFTSNMNYLHPDSIRNRHDLLTYFRNVHSASKKRKCEAEKICSDITGKKYVILLGDFNDVGGSSAICSLEDEGLLDAWWKGGFGYGATIQSPLPYRIDHVLYSNALVLCKIKIVNSRELSDHDALYAVLGYN